MNFKKILCGLMLAASALCATAQPALTLFSTDARTYVLCATNLATGKTAVSPIVDTTGMYGIAVINVFYGPDNYADTAITTVATSPDKTNWTTMASCAIATNALYAHTNYFYGGAGLGTSMTNLQPYSVITPTASSAGFATTYPATIPMTNSALFTNTGPTWTQIGFNVSDQAKYFRFTTVTTEVTGTNAALAATLMAPFAAQVWGSH